jgi:hypothetical protein
MQNDTEKQEKVEKLKKYIDEARKAHDTATVEALGEKLFDLTGVKEPEFDAEVSSGNPKLDRLKKALIQSIAARDEPTEVILRDKIKDMEAESEPIIPEMDVVLAEEPVIKESLATEPVQENYTDEEVVDAEDPFEEAIENKEIGDRLKDVLMATQIAALREVGILTEVDLVKLADGAEDPMEALVLIKGIGKASAKTILEALGYEA